MHALLLSLLILPSTLSLQPIFSQFRCDLRKLVKRTRGGSTVQGSQADLPDELWNPEASDRKLPDFFVELLKQERKNLDIEKGGVVNYDRLRSLRRNFKASEAPSGHNVTEDGPIYLDAAARERLEREERKKELMRREELRKQADLNRWIEEENTKEEEKKKRTEYENYIQTLPETKMMKGDVAYRPKKIHYKRKGLSTKDFDWKAEEDTMQGAYMPYEIVEASISSDPREAKRRRLEMIASMNGISDEMRKQMESQIAREIDKVEHSQHWSDKTLSEMTERDWRILKEDHRITYKGVWNANPMRNWEESRLPRDILKAIEDVGYERPTPIQMAAIPLGLSGRDVIGVASTGSGKTCAFVIPLLMKMAQLPRLNVMTAENGPYGLILAPTRELALQIEEEAKKFAKYLGIRIMSVVGGQGMESQGNLIRKGIEIVIATPGRARDMLERQHLVLGQCNFVVMDEADRMVDLGFDEQINELLKAMPSKTFPLTNDTTTDQTHTMLRKTYMFSATMPPTVETIARKYMRDPVMVLVGEVGSISRDIKQEVIFMENDEDRRVLKLQDVLRNHFVHDRRQVLVFVNRKDDADVLAKRVAKWNLKADSVHSGKPQGMRRNTIEAFRQNRFQVLVATDVLGRGIDFKDIGLVVNYEMPSTIQHYTHRVGRTGRAGKKGTAVSFLTIADKAIFGDLKSLLRESSATVPYELQNEAFDEGGRPVFFE